MLLHCGIDSPLLQPILTAGAANPSSKANESPGAAAMEMGHLPSSVADWSRGAQLYEGLGERQITTISPEAQKYFGQCMRVALTGATKLQLAHDGRHPER